MQSSDEKLNEISKAAPPGQPARRGPLMTFALLVLAMWGIATARPFLVPLCIAALFAFVMTPLVRLFKRAHIPEWLGITVTLVLFLLPFLGLGYGAVRQGQSLVEDFPQIADSFTRWLADFTTSGIGKRLGLAELDLPALMQKFSSGAGQGIALVVGGLSALLNAGSQLLLIVLFAILMTASRGHLRRSGEKLLARAESIHAPTLLDEITSLIQQFLFAKLTVVAIMGAASALALKLFGLKYAFLLGSLVGVTTLIPNIGFLLAVIPIVIVALATGHSFIMTGLMVAVLVIINAIEGNVLTPKLVGRKINLNELASIVGFFAGSLLWGVWGMFLAIPILGIVRIVFSAIPSLQPWGELLAEREDHGLAPRLLRKHKAEETRKAA